MNLCILLGKIVSEIEFKFIIKGKNRSIAYFDMELLNKSIIRINAYDKNADYIYRKMNTGKEIIVKGKLRANGNIECEEFFV